MRKNHFIFIIMLAFVCYANVRAQQIKIVCDATEHTRIAGREETDKILRSINESIDTIFISKTLNSMTVSSYRMGWKLVFYSGDNRYKTTSGQMGHQDGRPINVDMYVLYIKGDNYRYINYTKCTNQLIGSAMIVAISSTRWYSHNIKQGYILNKHTGKWEDAFSIPGKNIDGLDIYIINSLKEFGGSKQAGHNNTSGRTSPSSAVRRTETITLRGTGHSFKMVYVGGGSFGYRDTYSKTVGSFYIGQTEVTQSLWKAVMKTNPSIDKGDDLPVNNITYQQALTFCRKLSSLTGKKIRLPNDIEWEYAAMGGQASQGYLYAGSDNPLEVGWFKENSLGKLHSVGQKKPNELGIYDMSGNVCEMCNDYIDRSHPESKNLPGAERRARGGRWETSGVAIRGKNYDYYSDYYAQGFGTRYVGFRVVMEQ